MHSRSPLTRVRVALFALVLALLGPLVKPWSAQPGSRFALTAAIVEQGSLRIDAYRAGTVASDRIEAPDGHTYSDKAPGQPILAVPVYALARLVGAEPATTVRVNGNLGLWWVTLWSSTIPAAVLVVLLHVAATRRRPDAAVPVALGLLIGSPLVVFAVELYGHVLATTLVFAAWLLVDDGSPSRRRAALAGLLAGAAVTVELPVALAALVIAVVLAARRQPGSCLAFVIGTTPAAALLAAYQTAAFGSPWRTPYSLHAVVYGEPDVATGPPRLDVITQLLVGTRGFVLTPIVLAGLVAATVAVVRRTELAADGGVALAMFAVLLLFQATRRTDWPGPLGGEMPAPRHLLPAVPFLAVPLIWVWRRAPVGFLALCSIGAVVMALPTLTLHLIPPDAPFVGWYRSMIDQQGLSPTVFTLALGPAGWLLHAALVAAAVAALAKVSGRAGVTPSPRSVSDARAA